MPESTGNELLTGQFARGKSLIRSYGMSGPRIIECSFLIPMCGDTALSDGSPHSQTEWEWLEDELWNKFRGATTAPGFYSGFYADPDSGARVSDESKKFLVAIADDRIDDLRALMSECCVMFNQKCIYLSIAGEVEFIERPIP